MLFSLIVYPKLSLLIAGNFDFIGIIKQTGLTYLQKFIAGQRWISEMEPELGLGMVIKVEDRFVEIDFPATETLRKYAMASAPLKRVHYKKGDTIRARNGDEIIISSVQNVEGLFLYSGNDKQIPESELNSASSFTTPLDRLMNGLMDRNSDFEMRYRARQFQTRLLSSPVRGFLGGRIELLPHQMYVAGEITKKHIPRVLLSDETGLGKTIEVCLILHRLLINGRIDRVLILLPPALVNQWFIELYRRFNLIFPIFDAEYCESLCTVDAETNPFLETQLGLCSLDFLATNPKWQEKAIAAGWDMVVIDEVHHLRKESPAYQMVNEISKISKGLILVTATPEQLGHESHFARLQLLDPARYHSFQLFEQEHERYQEISRIANKLLERKNISGKDLDIIADLLNKKKSTIEGKAAHTDRLLTELIDRYGTGRVIFRNTRMTITGFPKRIANLWALAGDPDDLKQCSAEFLSDLESKQSPTVFNYNKDPRIDWLIDLLKKEKEAKVLLICHSPEKVLAIETALRAKRDIKMVLFHEQMSLLQRDRNAAWFAEKGGARIMLCSEIGSEGRNFQFAHQLVLFDLPLDPELLEQRIGRLDRIGQKKNIQVHVPYLNGSEYEVLARWYHEGLNAFAKNVPGVYQIYQKLGTEIKKIAELKESNALPSFIAATKKEASEISNKIISGRDRLLELNSFQPQKAQQLIREIEKVDSEEVFKAFMIEVFNLFGIRETKISAGIYKLDMYGMTDNSFPLPLLNKEEPIVTFNRDIAITREDIDFLSWDHPLTTAIMDFLPGTEKGNCVVAVWQDEEKYELLLEAVFVLESLAAKRLNVNRFLPPTAIRVVVNHELAECGKKYPFTLLLEKLKHYHELPILENRQVRIELIPAMLGKCEEFARVESIAFIQSSLKEMSTSMNREIDRLTELQKINTDIRNEEISLLVKEKNDLKEVISKAGIRLDALRFVFRGVVE